MSRERIEQEIIEQELELDENMRLFDPKAREAFHKQPMEKKEKSLKAKSFIIYPFELFYNQDKTFEEKEEETLFLIKEHLKKYKRTFVSTSFGMDSIVMMHMVLRAWQELKNDGINIPKPDMFLADTLNTFKEEKQYWEQIIELFDIKDNFKMFKPPKDKDGRQYTVWSIAKKYKHLPSFRSMQRESKNRKIGSRGVTPECCNILKKKSLKNFLKSLPEIDRYDCHFVGTRAEESRMRAMSLLQRCRSYIVKTIFPYPIRTVTPLSYWVKADIYEYYARYNIPKNPAYKAHNMDRMGCASCPAHKFWEIRLAKDPTNEGFGMLKQNFKILKETEPERLVKSIQVLKRYIKKKESYKELSDDSRMKVEKLIKDFDINE